MARPTGSKNKSKALKKPIPKPKKSYRLWSPKPKLPPVDASALSQEEIEKRIDAILPVLADQGYTKEDLLNAFATNANLALSCIQRMEELITGLHKETLVLKEVEDTHQLRHFQPYPYQQEVFDAFREGFNIVIVPISNKVGKTRVGSALIHSWAIGYEPWNPVDKNFEGAVKGFDGYYYMPSSLGKKPPVKILVSGEDWEEHVGETLVPEIKFFVQDDEWKTTKNNMGVENHWVHKKTKSEIRIMTYRQDKDLFESFKCDAWWPDEPPPEKIWGGMARALFMKNGKVFMSMTPLKEAWIFDELVNGNRVDVKTIQNITLWDAPHLYDNDLGVLIQAGMSKEQAIEVLALQKKEARSTKDLPKTEQLIKELAGNKIVEFVNEFGQKFRMDAVVFVLRHLQIHRLIKELKDDSERIPRVFGEPKHLMGRVWKKFDINLHRVKDFDVPVDWPVDFQIDFHPSENIAISFRAIDRYGRNFIVDEVWQHLTNSQIVDEIVRRRDREDWRMVGGEIDALAKGDSAYAKNRHGQSEDSFYEIQRLLKQHGLRLGVGSKAEQNYIAKVDEWMGNDPPLFFVQWHCTETIRQIDRWIYEENGKPSDKGHFCECIGRHSQTGLRYTEFEEKEEIDYAALVAQAKSPLEGRI